MRTSNTRVALGTVVLSVLTLLWTASGVSAKPPGGGGGPKNGTLVGEVVGDGGPIAGATVMLFNDVAIDQIAETITGADGTFQFGKVPAGDYSVTAVSFNPPCWGNADVTVAAKKLTLVVVACQ